LQRSATTIYFKFENLTKIVKLGLRAAAKANPDFWGTLKLGSLRVLKSLFSGREIGK